MATGTARASLGCHVAALALAGVVAAAPVLAQTAAPATTTFRPDPTARPPVSSPLRDAVRRAARHHDALTQAPPRRGPRCAVRIPLLAAAGAAVFAGTALGLLAAGDGSDAANSVIVNWALLGAAAGGVAGLVTCL